MPAITAVPKSASTTTLPQSNPLHPGHRTRQFGINWSTYGGRALWAAHAGTRAAARFGRRRDRVLHAGDVRAARPAVSTPSPPPGTRSPARSPTITRSTCRATTGLGVDHALYRGQLRSDKAVGQPLLDVPVYLAGRALGAEPAEDLRDTGRSRHVVVHAVVLARALRRARRPDVSLRPPLRTRARAPGRAGARLRNDDAAPRRQSVRPRARGAARLRRARGDRTSCAERTPARGRRRAGGSRGRGGVPRGDRRGGGVRRGRAARASSQPLDDGGGVVPGAARRLVSSSGIRRVVAHAFRVLRG